MIIYTDNQRFHKKHKKRLTGKQKTQFFLVTL